MCKKPTGPATQTPADYSSEFPRSPQEKQRAAGHADDAKSREELPDPADEAAPYGSTNVHGTNDTSRFSTPPPKRP